jgi:hypothetical protein
MKLNTKQKSILSGIFMALSAALGACGTGNNVVPPIQQPAIVGSGQCAYGPSYYPNNYSNGGYYPGGGYHGGHHPGGGYGYGYGGQYNLGCVAGYTYYGGQCACTAGYYNNNGGGYYNNGCPVGYVMGYSGRCVYNSSGYNYCPPGQYGCRY